MVIWKFQFQSDFYVHIRIAQIYNTVSFIARASRPNKLGALKPSIHVAFTWHTPNHSSKHFETIEFTLQSSSSCLERIPPVDKSTQNTDYMYYLICPTSAKQGRFLKVGKSVRAAPILDLRLGRLWEERRASAGGLSCRLIFQTSLIVAPPS
jgi:hypothetical protein